jgi:hypothetical protein
MKSGSSWNPKGLSRAVIRELYLYLYLYSTTEFIKIMFLVFTMLRINLVFLDYDTT